MRFESDKDAWEFLAAAGYDEDSFVISLPANREPTKDEGAAILYLCDEWDWATEL